MNPPLPTPSSPHRWQALVLLLLIFAIGLGCGLGGSLWFLHRQVRKALETPANGPAPVDRLMERWEKDLDARLQFTDSERAQVHAALNQSATHFKDLRTRTAGEIRGITAQMVQQIGAGLPPEKAARARAIIIRRISAWGLWRRSPEATPTPAAVK